MEQAFSNNMKNKAFTLLEILISISLLVLLFGACILSTTFHVNGQTELNNKVIDFITITKHAQYNAEITGNKLSLIIESNKLNVISRDYAGNEIKLFMFNDQLDNINNNMLFVSNETNIITYLSDGSVENNNVLNISIDNTDDTNAISISINKWNRVTTINTNKIDDEDLLNAPVTQLEE